MAEGQRQICDRCKTETEPIEVTFSYLDRSFRHKAPRCPRCGQVYIPEEFAKGRMRAVEEALEEK
jgi:ribosomal protein S27AE